MCDQCDEQIMEVQNDLQKILVEWFEAGAEGDVSPESKNHARLTAAGMLMNIADHFVKEAGIDQDQFILQRVASKYGATGVMLFGGDHGTPEEVAKQLGMELTKGEPGAENELGTISPGILSMPKTETEH